ncbi:hypothetical protein HDE_06214 [Halotydeus destructor]|nr:hypothetical protein HDE_06214 [Halotydeus destructor]
MSKRASTSEPDWEPKRRMMDLQTVASQVDHLISLWSENSGTETDRITQTLEFLETFKDILEPPQMLASETRRFGLRLFGKETTINAQEFIQRVKQRLGIRSTGIAVKDWEPLGSSSVLIHFRDEISMINMKRLVKSYLEDFCTVQDLKRPTVLVTGLPSKETRAVLQPLLKHGEILFIKKPNRWNQCSAAIMLDRAEKIRLLREGRIYGNLTSYKVFDYVHVKTCFKCQKYGHKSSECHSEYPVCAYCIRSHRSKECSFKNDYSQIRCANCAFDFNDKSCIGQHRTHTLSCPIYQSQIEFTLHLTA